ncbi:MAG: GGDEF domain-containing protein [Eubacterium sp.]|nr:GGDEF domain-containing protein [Eubacterium sp.]
MFQRITDIMLYAGLDKEAYQQVKEEINAANRKNLLAFSVIGLVAFGGLVIYAAIHQREMLRTFPIYVMGLAIMVAMFLITLIAAKQYPILIHICVYIYMIVVLTIGLILALLLGPTERTAALLGILMVIAGLFYVVPLGLLFTIVGAVICFLVIGHAVQEPDLFAVNALNVIFFGAVSGMVGIYMMRTRVARYYSEQVTRYLMERDQLTGILNRRSYEYTLAKIEEKNIDVYIVAFDLNGLKCANDNYGHTAGDELLKATAVSIEQAFGRYGKCFRTGGDEFMAVLTDMTVDIEDAKREFRDITESWKGEYTEHLYVSYGVAFSKDLPEAGVKELARIADQYMYDAKAKFYQKHDINRRRR